MGGVRPTPTPESARLCLAPGRASFRSNNGQKDGTGNDIYHAFLWKPTTIGGSIGTMYDLGTFPSGGDSEATGINDAGKIVGTAAVANSNSTFNAFFWTPTVSNGTVGSLQNLDTNGFMSEAYGINNSDQIVGYITDDYGEFISDLDQQAVVWKGGLVHNLNTLSTLRAGFQSLDTAYCVNDIGQIGGTNYDATGFLLTPK